MFAWALHLEAEVTVQSLRDQQVLVLGLGTSGLAMARWCVRQGAHVTVLDTRESPPMLATLIIYAGGGLWVSIAAAGLLGLCSGGDNSLSILLARRYFSVETFGRASATQMVAMAAGGGVSPWIAGLVHDRTGNYDLALLMAAACMGGAALAAAWLPEFRPGDDSTAQRLGAGG